MKRFQPIFDRVFGVKPGGDAPKLERLLWFRRYYLRNLVLMAPALFLVTLFWPVWAAAVLALPWLLGFARLNLEIRREHRPR